MYKGKYSKYFVLEKLIKEKGHVIDRKELIYQLTDGKHESLKALSPDEFSQIISDMREFFDLGTALDASRESWKRLHAKIAGIYFRLDWTKAEFEDWCLKYRKKSSSKMTQADLQALIPILQKILKKHINQVTS